MPGEIIPSSELQVQVDIYGAGAKDKGAVSGTPANPMAESRQVFKGVVKDRTEGFLPGQGGSAGDAVNVIA